jgi:hypothetical protein
MADQGGGKRRCGGMAMIAPFVRLKPSAWPGSPSAATHAWSRGFSGPSKIFSKRAFEFIGLDAGLSCAVVKERSRSMGEIGWPRQG